MPNPPPQQGKNQSIQLRAATAIRAQSIGENFNTALYLNFTNTFFGDHIETPHAPAPFNLITFRSDLPKRPPLTLERPRSVSSEY